MDMIKDKNIINLSHATLLEAYEKALELKLDADFIEMLKNEIRKRERVEK